MLMLKEFREAVAALGALALLAHFVRYVRKRVLYRKKGAENAPVLPILAEFMPNSTETGRMLAPISGSRI